MTIAIITKNEHLKTLLIVALKSLELKIKFYDVLPTKLNEIMAIVDDGVASKIQIEDLAKKIPLFVIIKHTSHIENVIGSFQIPLRLGSLVEAVRHQIKYYKQKEKLKPIQIAGLKLDPKTNKLENLTESSFVILTEKEQEILLYLYVQKDKSTKRDELLRHIWGYVQGIDTHTLETHIYRLRQKIEIDPSNPQILITDEDGYKLNF